MSETKATTSGTRMRWFIAGMVAGILALVRKMGADDRV